MDKPAKFVIECEPAIGTPKVQILSPSRIALPVQLVPLDTTGRYSAQFVAKDVGKIEIINFHIASLILIFILFVRLTRISLPGDHSVEVKLNGSHVEGSPFLIKAYDASKVKVTDINSGFVDTPVYFTSKARIY